MGKYFGTDGFRGEANKSLTFEHAIQIGRFLGWYYGANQGKKAKVVIGKDTRRSSYMYEYALCTGLMASGADAYIMHVTTTPSVAYITRVDDVQCCPPSDSMQLWADYLRMLRDSECDLTDSKLVYTHSLKREHDKVARKLTQINDEKLVKAFEQKASDNEWLEYKGKQLSAIVPHNLSELYEEGRKLSHCVGTYARSVVNGNSIIVFLRKNTKLSVPYCTVEVRGKKIVQVRGWDNREGVHVPDINSFLKVWSEKKGLELMVA